MRHGRPVNRGKPSPKARGLRSQNTAAGEILVIWRLLGDQTAASGELIAFVPVGARRAIQDGLWLSLEYAPKAERHHVFLLQAVCSEIFSANRKPT